MAEVKATSRKTAYDLIGLTTEEMAVLRALLGAYQGGRGGVDTYSLYNKINEALSGDPDHRERRVMVTHTGSYYDAKPLPGSLFTEEV